MVSVGIVSDVDRVFAKIEAGMTPATAKALLKAANFAGGAIAEEATGEFSGGTGQLARSFLPARFVETGEGKIGAGALSDLPHARVQDEGSGYLPGGVITPRQMQYLSIPLNKDAARQWPRDRNDLFFLQVKATRNKFLAKRVGGKISFEYLLRKSVKIKPTRYIQIAAEKTEPVSVEILDKAMQANIDQAEK